MASKVLIFGAAGYIGCELSRYLYKKKYEIYALDSLLYKNRFSLLDVIKKKNFNFYNNSLLSDKKLEKIIKSVNFIIYLAGLVGDPITKKYPKESKYHNFEYINKIIDLTRKNKKLNKFIFISTCSNYGIVKKDIYAKESQVLKPLSLYAKQKVKIEKKLLSKKNQIINPVILRFATAFGLSKRMRFDLTVNQFVKDLFFKKKLIIYDASTWRPYCHVKDFCRLIHKTMKTKNKKIIGQVFNAGGDKNNFTKQGILNLIKKKIKDNKIIYKKNDVDPRNYKVDFGKVKRILNFKPSYSVQYGIVEILKALKNKKIKKIKQESNFGNYRI